MRFEPVSVAVRSGAERLRAFGRGGLADSVLHGNIVSVPRLPKLLIAEECTNRVTNLDCHIQQF